MGILDKLTGEFIEWQDSSNDILVWRFPRYQNEIKMGAKLTVRESQVAVFMNEGRIADAYPPGMYTLDTQNMPVLSTLRGWKYGFNSPFKADVYFVSTRQFTDQKWGTKNPIIVDDSRFGMIELRAFGTYAFRVDDASLFLKEIAGTDAQFSTDEIGGQLRSLIVTKFSDAVGEGGIPVEKFAANLEELSALSQERLTGDLAAYGLKLSRFLVENVSMPDELKKEIFEYSRLGKIDMQKLAQFKAAQSIEQAAANPGGTAGLGVGMGAGIAMGQVVAGAFAPGLAAAPAAAAVPPPLPPAAVQFFVAVKGKQEGPYPLEQLNQQIAEGQVQRDTLVWKPGMASWSEAQTVAELQPAFAAMPPPLPPVR
jgi:membrane protease subunit (stomatin/prohibitin family)